MKKAFIVFLAVSLVFLTACGVQKPNEESANAEQSSNGTTIHPEDETSTVAETTPVLSTEPTEGAAAADYADDWKAAYIDF